jgi:hypothetical protein
MVHFFSPISLLRQVTAETIRHPRVVAGIALHLVIGMRKCFLIAGQGEC